MRGLEKAKAPCIHPAAYVVETTSWEGSESVVHYHCSRCGCILEKTETKSGSKVRTYYVELH